LGPALHEMTPGTICSGLVQNPPSSTPFVPPSRSDWDFVEEDNHDIEVAHMGNDPYFGIPIPEVPSDQSSL
ncbi:hypothetical protein Tco_0443884, partial [Tanacetum coccineum]